MGGHGISVEFQQLLQLLLISIAPCLDAYVYNVCEAHVDHCLLSSHCPANSKCIKTGSTGTGGCYCQRGYCAVNAQCVLTKRPSGPPQAPSLNLSLWFLDEKEMLSATGGVQRPLMQLFSRGSSGTFFAEAQSMWRHLYSDIGRLGDKGLLYDTSWLLGSQYKLWPELDQAGTANTSLAQVFADAAGRGSDVLALAWRNYAHGTGGLREEEDFVARIQEASAAIHKAGSTNRAEAYVDGRINTLGSLHQKSLVVGIPKQLVAYLGGIDFCEDRWDVHGSNTTYPLATTPSGVARQKKAAALRNASGAGEPNNEKYRTGGWHDNEVRVSGPGAYDVAVNFANRWNEQACFLTDVYPVRQGPLKPIADLNVSDFGPANGTLAIQMLRTYGCQYAVRSGCYRSFAPKGETSVLAGLIKAIRAAKHFIYLEGQYFFFVQDIYDALRAALRHGLSHLIATVQYPEEDEGFSTIMWKAWYPLYQEFPDRVHFYYRLGGVYIHSKTKVIDDVYMMMGSANLNYRSTTGDAEMSAGIVDEATTISAEGFRVAKAAHDFRIVLWEDQTGIPQDVWRNTTVDDAVKLWDEVAAKPNARIAKFHWSWEGGPHNIPEYQAEFDNAAFLDEIDPDNRCQ